MSHTPHTLPEEFPAEVDKMQALRQSDPHFTKIADEYEQINKAVHLAETDVTPTSDAHMEDMRKTRLHLKDQIATHLRTA